MSIGNHVGSQSYDANADQVFEALVSTLEKNKFKITQVDKRMRRVSASTGWSLLSFGENISVVVSPTSDNSCRVDVDSGVKIAANATSGSHRNQRNIDAIFFGIGRELP